MNFKFLNSSIKRHRTIGKGRKHKIGAKISMIISLLIKTSVWMADLCQRCSPSQSPNTAPSSPRQTNPRCCREGTGNWAPFCRSYSRRRALPWGAGRWGACRETGRRPPGPAPPGRCHGRSACGGACSGYFSDPLLHHKLCTGGAVK